MSRILDLGIQLENLVKIISEYDEPLKEAEEHLKIKGKQIGAANVENPTWQYFYDQRRIELGTIVRFLEQEIARVRSKLYKKYKEGYSRELNEREINKYIDHEEDFLSKQELLIEVKEMYEQYESVVNSFTTRSYALNNLAKLYVSSLEASEL